MTQSGILAGSSKVLVEKFNVIMTLGGGVLVHDVLQLHCHQILVVLYTFAWLNEV